MNAGFRNYPALVATAALALWAAQPTLVWSQETTTATSGPNGGALEEIIVTARKKSENIQDVPISITAFTGRELEARGVENLSGVARFTPNLSIDSTAAVSGSSIASTVFIRGIGQTDFTPNSDPGVGVYLDGVYLSRSIGSLLDLVDIQSVEVLRGPQGTLFGKNTDGGAINVTSIAPSDQAGGHVEVEGGSFARRNVKATLDAPISSTLLTSLSVASLQEDGYQKRILDPSAPELGDVNRFLARGRALWKPVDNFSADIIVDYSRGREQSVAQSVLVINPNTGAPFLAAAAGLIPGTTATIRPGFAGQFTGASLLNGTFITSNPDLTYYAGPSMSNFDILGESVTLSYDVAGMHLKSISAYRHLTSEFARDSLSSPFLVADTFDDYHDKQWSQEIQLLGDLPNDRGTYVAGLYYLGEKGLDYNLVATSIGDLGSGGTTDNYSAAAFAQTNLKITESLGVTLGGRYTDEKKGFTPSYNGGPQQFLSNANGLALGLPPVLPLIIPGDYKTTAKRLNYTASLQEKFTAALMGYVSYSTGFKSGGFSQRIGPHGPDAIPAPSFGPETDGVVELGLKWLGLNDRLRINGDVFRTIYHDVQITPIFEGIGPVTRNAGNAQIVGGELEADFLPNRHWEIQGGLGLLDTRYLSLSPDTLNDKNLNGTPILTLHSSLAKSPHTSLNLSGVHKWDLPEGNVLSFRIDGGYTSHMFNDVLDSPELARPGMTLLGSALTFTTADGHWNVAFRGTNLTNRHYIIAGNAEHYEGNIGYTQATYARPREMWLNIRRTF